MADVRYIQLGNGLWMRVEVNDAKPDRWERDLDKLARGIRTLCGIEEPQPEEQPP